MLPARSGPHRRPRPLPSLPCVPPPVALCLQAFPTLKLFINGELYSPDYAGHRTVQDFSSYLFSKAEGLVSSLFYFLYNSVENSIFKICSVPGSFFPVLIDATRRYHLRKKKMILTGIEENSRLHTHNLNTYLVRLSPSLRTPNTKKTAVDQDETFFFHNVDTESRSVFVFLFFVCVSYLGKRSILLVPRCVLAVF